MAASALPNVSADLLWEITRGNNCYLVKNKQNGGIEFSRDPMNLTNKNSRKHAGYLNDKAVGIIANEKGGVTVSSKKSGSLNKPGSGFTKTTHGGNRSSRSTYRTVANQTAKTGYRADLRSAAVERVSAIRKTQRPVKEDREPKLRGNKAKRAAEAESS